MTSPSSSLPLWARLADVLVITIAAAALSVAVFGGFRVLLFGTQITYPTAFVYNVPYTEGLFLLGSLATFYHFGRHQFVSAALWGTVIGLSRPNGFILAAPLVAIALARSGPFPTLAPWVDRLNTRADLPRHLWRDLVVALTPFAGLLLYCAYRTGRGAMRSSGHGCTERGGEPTKGSDLPCSQ